MRLKTNGNNLYQLFIMVNTVFSCQSICNSNTVNSNTVNSNTVQSGTINRYLKILIDYIDKLHVGIEIPYSKIGNTLDIIMKYLYDSFLTNNSHSHKVLTLNTYNALQTILEEMEGILGNTSEYILLLGILSDNVRSFLDGSNPAQSNIVDTLELTKENIRTMLQKIQNNDLNPFDDYKRQIVQYDKMKHLVLDSLTLYTTYFKEGDFSKLKDEFDETEQNEIGQKLVSDTLFVITQQELDSYTNTNQLFDQYRSFIFQMIDGLNAAILLDNTNSNLQADKNDLGEYKTILTDPKLLNEYINTHYKNFNAQSSFIDVGLSVGIPLTLKPEYAEYIKLYGVTDVWDAEKLQTIIQSLQTNA